MVLLIGLCYNGTVLYYGDIIASFPLQTRLASNTASTKRKLSLLIFDSAEHCRGCDDDYISEYASNKLQMFADSSNQQFHIIHVQQSQAHAHECFDFVVYKADR